jgi:hypothetical protein
LESHQVRRELAKKSLALESEFDAPEWFPVIVMLAEFVNDVVGVKFFEISTAKEHHLSSTWRS